MMNRFMRGLPLLLAVCLWAGLVTSCGSPKENKYEKEVDLEAFYTAIETKYETQMGMQAVPNDLLPDFFPGLAEISTESRVIYISAITMATQEFALIKVSKEEDAQAVREILQARIDYQIEQGAWYPAAIDAWQNNAKLAVYGPYVVMVVHPDAEKIIGDFEAEFQ